MATAVLRGWSCAGRFLLVALLLSSTAVVVSDDANDDPPPEDYSDPALSEDPVATEPHEDVEPASIFPESPDGKVPQGASTDLVVALANNGANIFNVSHIEAKLTTASGKIIRDLERYEYDQQLGAREQRSFRYPLPIDLETPLGEVTFMASIYYNTKRDKQPYVSVVYNETIEIVPPLPDKVAQMRAIQLGAGGCLIVLLVLSAARFLLGGTPSAGKPSSKKASAGEGAAAKATGDEWLKDTLAAKSSNDKPRKSKKA